MKNESNKLNNEQLEAVRGGDAAQWIVKGYCPNCQKHKFIYCSMYPSTTSFDCSSCGTPLENVIIEPY